jgi:short-subunit dehydrogenase
VGTTYVTSKFLGHLRASRGRVVQISSVLGKTTVATRAVYAASKHGLEVSDRARGSAPSLRAQCICTAPGQ